MPNISERGFFAKKINVLVQLTAFPKTPSQMSDMVIYKPLGGYVNYAENICFLSDQNVLARSNVLKALKEIETKSCIRFRRKGSDMSYLHFYEGSG